MTAQDYSVSITANITPVEATERINRVADWWTASFTGSTEKIGDAFKVQWGETFVDFAVVEHVGAKRIVWRVTDCNLPFTADKKEWKDTQIVFEVSSDGTATTVNMTHVGLAPAVECYEACTKGWNFFITESLQQLLAGKKGMPDRVGKQERLQEVAAAAQ